MKQKTAKEAEWKAEIEKKLAAGQFIGGASPNDEDKSCHMLMNETFDLKGTFKYGAVTEETHPLMFKWMTAMDAQK